MIKLHATLMTSFHKALATPAWISTLEAFLADQVRASGAYKSIQGSGTVRSRYTEERFMGAASVVKFRFEVDVQVSREEPGARPDRYQAAIEYDPQSTSFSCSPRGEHISTVETREQFRAEMRRQKEEWIASLKPLESKEEFERRQCPVCLGKLRARFYPEGRSWFYGCASHVAHHRSIWNGVCLDPGGWWTDGVADRTCPGCGSSNEVVGLLYGLVIMEVDPKVWELGGCVFNPNTANLWHCRSCSLDFVEGARERR